MINGVLLSLFVSQHNLRIVSKICSIQDFFSAENLGKITIQYNNFKYYCNVFETE